MDRFEMIAEMRRKPDVDVLLNWMYEQVPDDVKDVIDAYFEGVDAS